MPSTLKKCLSGIVMSGLIVIGVQAHDVLPLAAATSSPQSTAIQSTKADYTLSELTFNRYTHLTSDQQKAIAQAWNLSSEDYTRYLLLMKTTVNGIYYKDRNLDPSWILGFNAKDEAERTKYVTIAIQNERARLAKELAFQQAFDRIQRKLYPNSLPIAHNNQTNLS